MYQPYNLNQIHDIWASLVAQSYKLSNNSFYLETLSLARELMKHVRENLLLIVAKLEAEGYNFVEPDRVYQPPQPETSEWIQDFSDKGIFIPVSLQAWLLEVGSINLIGTHPEWEKTAYFFEDMIPTNDVWYTDPLVVEVSEDYISYLYTEWLQRVNDSDSHPPFRVDFSPDHITKSNISGGEAYQLSTDTPAVDSLVFNERNCISFMGYLRLALDWGGFPGFKYIPEVNSDILVERVAIF